MSREQILVIEDNLDTAHQIVALCFKLGYEPLLARDGFTGMLLANKVHPRVIISDVETPGLDGFEIVRRVREHPELDHTAVIAITKNAPRRPVCENNAFDDYVLKPLISTTLGASINKFCLSEKPLAHAV